MSDWRERWIAWRNARLSDPAFQRFAAEFPLTRPTAHRRVGALFDVVAGFVYSQVLAACVELDLFNNIKDLPRTAEDLAAAHNIPADAMIRLLRAAETLGLVEAVGPRFALGAQGAAFLGNAGLADMVRHHQRLYADLQDPLALLRRGRGENLAHYWPYATSAAPEGADAAAVSAYSALMAATQPSVASDILRAYPMSRHRRIMDIGGGEGAFLAAVGARWPHLHLHLFDLPAVAQRARSVLAAHAGRSTISEGSFLRDPLPRGADLMTLVRVLHDHDDAGVATLFASAKAALPADGRLLIAEPMSAAPRKDRVSDAYFGLYLLAMGRGRARTPRELDGFMKDAGFRRTRLLHVRTPGLLRVMVASA